MFYDSRVRFAMVIEARFKNFLAKNDAIMIFGILKTDWIGI